MNNSPSETNAFVNLQSMKKIFLGLVLFGVISFCQAQVLDSSKQYKTLSIAFYNIENLYDTIDSPNTSDSEFTPEGPKNWNTFKYYKKLDHVSEVIAQLGVNNGAPDILGLCEIENIQVLHDLVKTPKLKPHGYKIAHFDSPDERGVDVALIYKGDIFNLQSNKFLRLKLPEDSSFKTRDMILVSGKIENENFHFIVSHWPSRRGGEKRSRPKRIAAAALAKHSIDSILTTNPSDKVIFMGDLNDDPMSISVTKNMSSTHDINKMTEKSLYNPMHSFYKKGIGTLAWKDSWNLFDQMLLSKSLTGKNYKEYQYYGTKIFNEPFVRQYEGTFKGYPFRTFAGDTFLGGYSDHFPVYIILVKEK